MKKLILAIAIIAISVAAYGQTDTLRGSMPNNGDVNKTGQGTLPSNGYNNGTNNGTNNRANPNPNNGTNQGIIPIDANLNKMNPEVTPKGVYRDMIWSDTLPNGTRITRSDTIRNGMYDKRMKSDKMGKMGNMDMRKMHSDTLPDGTKSPKMKNKMGEEMGDGRMHTMDGKMDHTMMRGSGEKHVMMENGKVVMMKNGSMKTVQNYTPLSNGTRVMSDGTIMKKDGTKTMMQEGECLNMAGEVVPMPMKN
jgi:hypothetical protein